MTTRWAFGGCGSLHPPPPPPPPSPAHVAPQPIGGGQGRGELQPFMLGWASSLEARAKVKKKKKQMRCSDQRVDLFSSHFVFFPPLQVRTLTKRLTLHGKLLNPWRRRHPPNAIHHGARRHVLNKNIMRGPHQHPRLSGDHLLKHVSAIFHSLGARRASAEIIHPLDALRKKKTGPNYIYC